MLALVGQSVEDANGVGVGSELADLGWANP
jgi:hypothetical protein